MSEAEKAALARSAMVAAEPLVYLFLELGITSPEAESLLRSLFVHKAREWLASSSKDGESPSDVRVSLVTGVHRNFVRRILAEPPRIAATRQQKGHRAERLLDAWHTHPAYLDSSGKPRDLSARASEPSFYSLATQYVPGAAPGVVLEELRRAGVVQMLTENRVRVRSRRFRLHGLNAGNIGEIGQRGRELLECLTHNLREPEEAQFCDSMPAIEVDAERLPIVRALIARRASTFLSAVGQEFAAEATASRRTRSKRRVRVGLTVFASEQSGNRRG
jgi:hypothetical protein